MEIYNRHQPIKRLSYFRFYEELNDFLSKDLHNKEFSYEFIGKPAIKDTIQAIGVPHVEIDLILVNGKSVGFDYQLQGNEKISVYPVFESLDISIVNHLRPKPFRELKFIVDVNLGKLAPKLRLLGFDTLFENNYNDAEIVKISIEDKRIILTRDIGILKCKDVVHGFWVRSTNPHEQLKEVVKRLQLKNQINPFTRCSICNGLLYSVKKELLEDYIPQKTFLQFDKFMECENCKKIYWRGSHCERIDQMIEELE